MNDKHPHDDENVEKLIRGTCGESARPTPAQREQAWQRVKAAWQAEQGAARKNTESSSTAPVQTNVQSESHKQNHHETNSLMRLILRNRWGFGLGAAAATAAIVLISTLASPKAHATAVQIMTRGAQAVAKLTSIHFRGQLRTLPADNFSYINADQDLYPVEYWKQLEPQLKWKVQKPGRMAVMNGTNTLHYINAANVAVKVDQPTQSAFDTDWLHNIANLSQAISNEIRQAQSRGWRLELTEETDAGGSAKAVVTIHAKSSVPENDYLKNAYLDNADTRRVYRFDVKSELLEAVQFYQVQPNKETLLFELSQIDYNQPIDDATWQVQLPADVSWYQEPQKLADNERYADMSAEQAARAFFEACSRKDWAEAGKFMSPINEQFKESLGGLQLISLGTPFTSQSYSGRFIPYEIKLPPQTAYILVASNAAAKRLVLVGVLDGTNLTQRLNPTGEAEILAAGDAAAALSAAEVVKAYFQAQASLNWSEMRKFTSQNDVTTTQKQVEMARKAGKDIAKMMPVVESAEATWSPEHSGYIVKCQINSGTKQWNLALRNDNPALRWQVDGGL
jgi:hypothetical protein